jgi:hypothetical protein
MALRTSIPLRATFRPESRWCDVHPLVMSQHLVTAVWNQTSSLSCTSNATSAPHSTLPMLEMAAHVPHSIAVENHLGAVNGGLECIELPNEVPPVLPSCGRTLLYCKGNALGDYNANRPIETLQMWVKLTNQRPHSSTYAQCKFQGNHVIA